MLDQFITIIPMKDFNYIESEVNLNNEFFNDLNLMREMDEQDGVIYVKNLPVKRRLMV